MTETAFRISVIIPAYNAEKHIARAVESVLKQTRPADEIIVVDDGSTDGTAGVVREFGPQTVLIEQPNAGASAARNTGIAAAAGNWIAFLDADDEWLPGKLALQVEHLQNHPHLVWTTGNFMECLCAENRRAEHISPQTCLRYTGGKEYFDSYFHAVERNLLGCTDCVLIQKRIFDEIGVFHTELPIAEDLDMWFRITHRYPQVGFLAQPLAIYHLMVADSLMVSTRPTTLYADFMRRQFALARQAGSMQTFIPAARAVMQRWIRGLLFRGGKHEIREMLASFPEVFSGRYRLLIRAVTVWPALTERMLGLLSRVVRLLRLRRRLTRPPRKRAGAARNSR